MAEIVLNVEVRERTGTGAAREARRSAKVPGVLYGGPRGPVPIAVNENEFRKALYTGKLLGHLVTLKYGDETQPVIAKDVQFHPVNDRPVHFDLYRVEAGGPVLLKQITLADGKKYSNGGAAFTTSTGTTFTSSRDALIASAPRPSWIRPYHIICQLCG